MFWDTIFGINAAQGLFIISVFYRRRKRNPAATWLLSAMIFIMVLTNAGYLVIRTNLVLVIPQVYLFSFGTLFLFGPLYYFYVKSVTESTFSWKSVYLLHFIPYLVQVFYSIPFYLTERNYIIEFINDFLTGNLPANREALLLFAAQIIHLTIYIMFAGKRIEHFRRTIEGNFIIPSEQRCNWLRELLILFIFLTFTLFFLFLFVLFKGKYNPITNYIYTVISTGIIYFISYKLVFRPELLNPDFTLKYKSLNHKKKSSDNFYLEKLSDLFNNEKIFLKQELSLSTVADLINISPHKLSGLINGNFRKSYNDFLNEYRINEFILRLNKPEFKHYSIYGLALEVGFNSKSSFNSAFKKITGKNPSDFKKLT